MGDYKAADGWSAYADKIEAIAGGEPEQTEGIEKVQSDANAKVQSTK